ncbi:Hypothetical predicted protein [Olea europaea subsp. europaea]|uniref:Uncharacterized protein n=1 Tax=Olea europaea subsp. europaea TaxID=158383 RepID=A0A8S0V4G2_OLEEU|nr:Hypothetical predicted protein [Olea europaea subsp. europaea]
MNNVAESIDSSPAVLEDHVNIDETSESVRGLPIEAKNDEESNKDSEQQEINNVVVPFTNEQPRSLEKRQSEDINEMSSKRKKHHALRMRADNHPDVIRENAALAASRSSTRESINSSPAVMQEVKVDETSESVRDLPTETKVDEEDYEVNKVVVPFTFTAEQPSDERRGPEASQMSIRPFLKRPSEEVNEASSKRERRRASMMRAQNDPGAMYITDLSVVVPVELRQQIMKS